MLYTAWLGGGEIKREIIGDRLVAYDCRRSSAASMLYRPVSSRFIDSASSPAQRFHLSHNCCCSICAGLSKQFDVIRLL